MSEHILRESVRAWAKRKRMNYIDAAKDMLKTYPASTESCQETRLFLIAEINTYRMHDWKVGPKGMP